MHPDEQPARHCTQRIIPEPSLTRQNTLNPLPGGQAVARGARTFQAPFGSATPIFNSWQNPPAATEIAGIGSLGDQAFLAEQPQIWWA
jgi:hypothetical protein